MDALYNFYEITFANQQMHTDSRNFGNRHQQTNINNKQFIIIAGETLVMTLFISNSFENRPPALTGAFAIVSFLVTLWLRGKFWRYATLLGFEGIIALLIVMAFPIMEMILEEIVQEKMRKVGEKIRAHDVRVKEFMKKRKEGKSSS